MAAFEGNVAAARYLLSLDADPNSAHTASGYNTPLHEAARSGSLAVVRLLLKSSANVLAVNSHGDHPLHVACREGRLDIARRLLAHDSDWATVAARNHAGLRPSEVVLGCSALALLLEQAEVTAARAAAKAAGAGAAAAAGKAPPLLPPAASSRTRPYGGRVGDLRRRGVRRKRAGRTGGSLSEKNASARALLSGSILPRWARLARPVGGEEEGRHRRHRRRAGPLDGPLQQQQQQQQQQEEREQEQQRQGDGVGGSDDDTAAPTVSDLDRSEAQSVAGWSGTSYGASLTDSDFGIPEAVACPGKKPLFA